MRLMVRTVNDYEHFVLFCLSIFDLCDCAYRLYSELDPYHWHYRVSDGVRIVCRAIKRHLSEVGLDLINGLERQSTSKKYGSHKMVIQLINLHNKCFNIVKEQCKDDKHVKEALKDGFKQFINSQSNCESVSISLARYSNYILSKKTRNEFTNLENTIERRVIAKLYIESRSHLEWKLKVENMFNDIQHSKKIDYIF